MTEELRPGNAGSFDQLRKQITENYSSYKNSSEAQREVAKRVKELQQDDRTGKSYKEK